MAKVDAKDSVPGQLAVEGTMRSAGRSVSEAADRAGLSSLRARWAGLAQRERMMLGVAAAVLGTFLVYVIAIRPAWNTVSEAPKRIAELDSQLQQMQRMASESKELRGTPRMPPSQSSTALKTATDAMGAAGRLTLAGDRATLTVTNANGDQLRRWLLDARTTARARPVEATLTRGAGGYSGSLIVALPAP